MSIPVNEIADEIVKALAEYSQEVAQVIKKSVDDVTNRELPKLKEKSPTLTKDYQKGWRKRDSFENARGKRKTIYNKTDYQLTHLLEYGHVSRNGERVSAYEHIKPVEEEIKQMLEQKIREGVQGQ